MHHLYQFAGETLPLHTRIEQVGSLIHDLGPLELQAELGYHDLADTLLGQPADSAAVGALEHLDYARDSAVFSHEPQHGSLDDVDLFGLETLLLPKFGNELVIGPAVPIDAADETNGDLELLGNIPSLPEFTKEA